MELYCVWAGVSFLLMICFGDKMWSQATLSRGLRGLVPRPPKMGLKQRSTDRIGPDGKGWDGVYINIYMYVDLQICRYVAIDMSYIHICMYTMAK